MSTIANLVGARIRKAREARSLSQRALSDMTQRMGQTIDPSAISRMERGTRGTTIEQVNALARAMSLTVTALLAGDEPRPDQTETTTLMRDAAGLIAKDEAMPPSFRGFLSAWLWDHAIERDLVGSANRCESPGDNNVAADLAREYLRERA